MNISKATKSVYSTLNKNAPVILTCVSIAGTIGTVGLAIQATPKAERLVQGLYSKKEEVTKRDIVEATWREYIPTMVMGAATITTIIFLNSVHNRRQAALAGMYTILKESADQYKEKVVEVIGENKARKIQDDIVEEKIKKNPPREVDVILTEKGNTLCYDVLSGRYFRSDIEYIRKIQNDLNHVILTDMWVSLNELYYALELGGTKLGDEFGWNPDCLLEFDFTSKLTADDEPCLVVDYVQDPKYNYRY